MKNVEVHLREHVCLLVELLFPIFAFCMGDKLIKVVYKRKLMSKRLNVSKSYARQVTFTPLNKGFSWLRESVVGLLHGW